MAEMAPGLDDILERAAKAGFDSPEQQGVIRMRYFDKYVKESEAYQKASLAGKQKLEDSFLGGMSLPKLAPGEGAVVPGVSLPGAAQATEPPHNPLVPPGPPQEMQTLPEQGDGVLSNIMSRLKSGAVDQMQPGGVLSPEAQLTAAGGVIGGFMGGPMAPMTALLGAGAGAAAGRGYEWLTSPGQAPPDVSSGIADLSGATSRGMTSEGIGQLGGAVLGAAGNRMLRPMGPLSQDAAQTMHNAGELGYPMRAGPIQESIGLNRAEDLPQKFIVGSGPGAQFTRGQKERATEILMEMAEQRSPGVRQDWQTIGNALVARSEHSEAHHMAAAGALYEHAKDLVGRDGRFAATALDDAASRVLGAELPLQSLRGAKAVNMATPFAENDIRRHILGYEPGRLYSFEDLHEITKRIGNAVRQADRNPTVQRSLMPMWIAAQNDLASAAETAGAPDALQLINRGNEYYRNFIVPVYRDRPFLHEMAKDPSVMAKHLASPSASIEQLRAMHRATAGRDWDSLRRAWTENLVNDSTVNGQFDAPTFVRNIRQYDPEKIHLLAGAQSRRLETFTRLLEREGRSTAGNSSALSMGQIIGFMSAVGSVGTVPVILGRVLNSERGIRWLTTGMQAPRTRAGAAALTKLMTEFGTLGVTRPGALGQLGFSPLPTPGPQPQPSPTPLPVP